LPLVIVSYRQFVPLNLHLGPVLSRLGDVRLDLGLGPEVVRKLLPTLGSPLGAVGLPLLQRAKPGTNSQMDRQNGFFAFANEGKDLSRPTSRTDSGLMTLSFQPSDGRLCAGIFFFFFLALSFSSTLPLAAGGSAVEGVGGARHI
jgi:hypothetical protein